MKNTALTQDQNGFLTDEFRDLAYEGLSFASRRTGELSDEFARLQVQIAGILFLFSALCLGYFGGASTLTVRFAFTFALFCLIASLATGLLHLKRKELFWSATARGRQIHFTKWQETAEGEGSFEEAHAFHKGASEAIAVFKAALPSTWIVQTVFLGIATTILFVLAVVFLFS